MTRKPDPTVDYQIGQRIRSARIEASMTQSDLGLALGCSSQQIHKYERGSNRVSAGTLFVIAEALGQNVEWFFLDAKKPDAAQFSESYQVH